MPNYCQNEVVIKAPSVAELERFQKEVVMDNKEDTLSLNKLFPMPASLDISADSRSDEAYALLYGPEPSPYPSFIESLSEAEKATRRQALSAGEIEIAQAMKSNFDNYGATNWYKWKNKNWSTKWDVDANIIASTLAKKEEETVYSFDSAWSPPVGAFVEGSKLYPEFEFIMYYWEDGADFVGKTHIKNGETLEDVVASYSERQSGPVNFSHYEVFEHEGKQAFRLFFTSSSFEEPNYIDNNTMVQNILSFEILSVKDFIELQNNEAAQENFFNTSVGKGILKNFKFSNEAVDLEDEDSDDRYEYEGQFEEAIQFVLNKDNFKSIFEKDLLENNLPNSIVSRYSTGKKKL